MATTPRKLRDNHSAEVLHFAPKGLFAPGQTLAVNTDLGTLSHLSLQDDRPIQIMEQQFTASEICVLVPLLQACPYYCPYEALLASFETGRVVNNETLILYRVRLQEAQRTNRWDEMMRSVRGVLSRMRLKTRYFNLEISAINEIGYMLRAAPVPVIPEGEMEQVPSVTRR